MESRTKKILVAVLAVIGGLLFLLIVAVIGVVMWFRTPTPVVDAVELVGEETTGYAILRLDADDPEDLGFVEALEDESTNAIRDGRIRMPFGIGGRADMDFLLPSQVAWTMSETMPGQTAGDDDHVLSISVPRYGRLMAIGQSVIPVMIAGPDADEIKTEAYGDEQIAILDTNNFRGAYFQRSGTVFLASSTEGARRALDRLRADSGTGQPSRGPTVLEALFAETAAESSLRAAIDNSGDGLSRLVETLEAMIGGDGGVARPGFDAIDLSNVHGLFLSGSFTSDGGFEGQGTIEAGGTPWSDRDAEALAEALGGLGPDQLRGADLEVGARAMGSLLELDFRIVNLARALVLRLPTGRLPERTEP